MISLTLVSKQNYYEFILLLIRFRWQLSPWRLTRTRLRRGSLPKVGLIKCSVPCESTNVPWAFFHILLLYNHFHFIPQSSEAERRWREGILNKMHEIAPGTWINPGDMWITLSILVRWDWDRRAVAVSSGVVRWLLIHQRSTFFQIFRYYLVMVFFGRAWVGFCSLSSSSAFLH